MNQQIVSIFRKYLDPQVFLQLTSIQQSHFVDENYLTLQRIAALANTKQTELLQLELEKSAIKPFTTEQVKMIKENNEKVITTILNPEVLQLISLLNDANNLDSLNPEEVKIKFPNVDSKRLSKVNVLKHISVDIIGSNYQLVDQVYRAAQLYYEMGQFEKSLHLLDHLKWFFDNSDRYENLKVNSLWGRIVIFAFFIIFVKNLRMVTQIFDPKMSREEQSKKISRALQDVKSLLLALEVQNPQNIQNPKNLKERTDLLIVTLLLVFTSQEPDFQILIELFNQEDLQKVVFTILPNLLGYYAASLFLTKNYDNQGQNQIISLEQLANLVNQYENLTPHPILEFINELLWNFNFEKSNDLLNNLQDYLKKDIILQSKAGWVVKHCKNLFFQTYIKIFSQIEIDTYSKYLKCSQEDAEVWLVNAIRVNNLQARIDGNIIEIFDSQSSGQNEQVTRVMKELFPKTQMLVKNLDMLLNNKQ